MLSFISAIRALVNSALYSERAKFRTLAEIFLLRADFSSEIDTAVKTLSLGSKRTTPITDVFLISLIL